VLEVSPERFDELVDAALDAFPDELAALVSNLVVLVEDEPPADDPELLGRYDGIALTVRQANDAGRLPDRILLFRGPLTRLVSTEAELTREVVVTVVHEVGHHFGIDEERLHELGYG
jgi:predicted Zn-dependent protease with MMP-like domain